MSRNQIIITVGSALFLAFALSQVSLYSGLFDYRFGFVALGAGILGLSAGLAFSYWLGDKPAGQAGAAWIAASGMGVAVFVAAALFVPFGTFATFLFLVFLSAAPFALWAMGVAALHREPRVSAQQFVWPVVAGATAGILASLWLLGLAGGPLSMSLWVAVAMAFIAMAAPGRRLAAMLSVVTFCVIGLAGIYSNWDFSSLPRWTQEEGATAKPLYIESMSGQVRRLSTQWDAFSRTDVVAHKDGNGNFQSVYTNGMFSGLMSAEHSGQNDSELLKKDFPLIALPLQAVRPRSILIINSGAGLQLRMAVDMDVAQIRGMESNLAMRSILEQWRDDHGGLSRYPGVEFTYGDVRSTLHRDSGHYDQIYLSVAQNQVPGWTEHGPAETYLYTKEAFRDYWLHLKPGGMLIILAGEERLYMRSLLMAWETLKENAVDDSLVHHSWGFRMPGIGLREKPYEYLLMLVKGPIADDLGVRVQELARAMPIVSLFGPNVIASTNYDVRYQPYNILYHPAGLDLARTALSGAMSWHLQAPTDMASATDQRPFFFQIVTGAHPFLKWLLASCLILLMYIFLFPLAAERRLDHPASGERPPLPVLLGYFLFLGVGATQTMLALVHLGIPFSGYPDYILPAVAGALLLGAAAGVAVHHRSIGYSAGQLQYGATTASAALCGLWYWIPGSFLEAASSWPALLRIMVIMGLAFPSGLFSVTLLLSGIDHLSRSFIALLPWAWVTLGLTAVGGVALAFWLAQNWGWEIVWITSAGCYLSILGASLWIRWAEKRKQPEMISAVT